MELKDYITQVIDNFQRIAGREEEMNFNIEIPISFDKDNNGKDIIVVSKNPLASKVSFSIRVSGDQKERKRYTRSYEEYRGFKI